MAAPSTRRAAGWAALRSSSFQSLSKVSLARILPACRWWAMAGAASVALVGNPLGVGTPLGLAPAQAASYRQAKIKRMIDGRQVYINGKTAKVNDVARSGSQVRTGKSRAELLFDNSSVGFLGRSSVITLGSDCLKIAKGSFLVSGPQRACLGSKVLGVKGTTFVIDRAGSNYNVIMLEGVAYIGDVDGYEETEEAKQKLEEARKNQEPLDSGDPSGKTTYLCGCELAQFTESGKFVKQAQLSRTQLLAVVNRFTDPGLQLPAGTAEKIQQTLGKCK